jgi:hypothetical protein
MSRAYGPLEPGGLSGPAPGYARQMTWPETYGGEDVMLVDGREAGTYVFWFEVVNTGSLPLTFDEFEDSPSQIRRISRVRISAQAYESEAPQPRFGPLEDTTLEPGARRVLEATVTTTQGCRDRGILTMMGDLDLRYGYGPFSRTQSVAFPWTLTFTCDPLPRER